MDKAAAQAAFLGLAREEQIEALAWLSTELTIIARDSYEVGTMGLVHPARLRRINELQHRLSGHLLKLLRNDPGRYADEVLTRIILEHEDDPELQRQIQRAFSHVLTQQTLA